LKERYIKILIVGGGAMAINHHLPRFFSLLGSEHVAIFEVDDARKYSLKNRFKKNDKIDILDTIPLNERYDLIVIATPPKFHYGYYRELQDMSDYFLIEKPMTLNSHQAAEVLELSTAADKKIFVSHIRRTLDSYKFLYTFYKNQYFGRLKKVVVNEGDVYSWNAVSLGSFSKDLNGGGVLMDTGPHTLDLLMQVLDKLILKSAYMDSVEIGIEANCLLHLVADSSVPVSVNLSRNRFLSNTAVFEFEKATLTAGVRDDSLNVKDLNGLEYAIHPLIQEETAVQVTYNMMIDNFYNNFLMLRRNDGISPAESLKILELTDAAYSNAKPLHGGF